MGHVTELTKRVRAVEKVCAIVSAVGIAGGGIVGTTVLNPQKAEACSPPLDGSEFVCPPWDDVVVCLSLDCPRPPLPQPNRKGITDQAFKDELNPNVFDQGTVITLYDTRVAHMGHSFPTGEWIEKIRDHESKKNRTPVEDSIGNALDELEWLEEE